MKNSKGKYKKGSYNKPASRNSKTARRNVRDNVEDQNYTDLNKGRSTLMEKDNDPSWYASNPQLLRDYASYPFGVPLGNSIANSYYQSPIPGIMCVYYYPSIGVATKETDPINVAMRKMYSFVRYANSGAKNYDAPDMMLYFIAADSATMYLEWMKRVYGVIFNYTAFNRYYPKSLVQMMGCDFQDLQSNLADFRGYINQYAVRLNQLWVPKGLSFMKRHKWMTTHIYVDSRESTKAQTYFYNPIGYYQFTVNGNPSVGKCVMKSFFGRKKLSEIITFGNSLLEPLIVNEDIGIISGDILKAYGINGVEGTMGIAEDYRVLPEYSEEVMSQFENLVAVYVNSGTLDVTQNTAVGGGYLVSQPRVMVTGSGGNSTVTVPPAAQQNVADAMAAPLLKSKLLNFHHENVTPEEVIVATRLMPTFGEVEWDQSNAPAAKMLVKSCGSELVDHIAISYNPTSTLVEPMTTAVWLRNVGGTVDERSQWLASIMNKYNYLSNFDWHPNIIINALCGDDGTDLSWTTSNVPFLDMDNYTNISEDNLANMHMTALLSEFTVPMIN